jgi:proteic killer suppression protein
MIQGFRDRATQRLFLSGETRRFQGITKQAAYRLGLLDRAGSLEELRAIPGNRLESLSGGRAGQYSIGVNRQWRICFRWGDDGPYDVEIVDYHG